ncbi:MAG: hypothetical protein ACE5NC_02090 [Anaerolineae bacterium]
MTTLLQFVSTYATWIYLVSAIGAVWATLGIRTSLREREASLFTLEREAASAHSRRWVALLLVFVALAGGTAMAEFSEAASPEIVAAPNPDPLLVPPPLPTPTPTATPPPEPSPTRPSRPPTPNPEELTPTAPPFVLPPCPNPRARITSPGVGATVRGLVTILGTADINGFAFYKIEWAAGPAPSQFEWAYLGGSDSPVVAGVLHQWDTSQVSPGTYSIRLVAADQTANYPPPCEYTIEIAPPA